MSERAAVDDWLEVDQYLAAFETARRAGPTADFDPFLPPAGGPLAETVLKEIVRVDMEFGWTEGRPTRLAEYQSRFPRLLADPETLAEIAFEEYRLRRQAGENLDPDEYRREFAVDVGQWPSSAAASVRGPDHSTQWAAQILPPTAGQPLTFPQAGERFAGFDLLSEIGRGAFSRVFLAEQPALANRKVVLKVCERTHSESERLAQLQHTHVVPIYSVHQLGRLQAICMPYFGATTLADVTKFVGGRESMPASGRALLDTVIARVGATVSDGATRSIAVAAPQRSADSTQTSADGPAAATVVEPGGAEWVAAPSGGPSEWGGDAGAWSAESKLLGELSYVEAVLWIIARAAEGLAHAHERGIVHQDLKPANVLLSDEGRPMLLDFNLSVDLKRRSSGARQAIGGTLPYMAPEQLRALRSGEEGCDARSDIYSLGVLLYELLTGRLPYAPHYGPVNDVAARMAEERRQPAASPRLANRNVTPAIESIIDRCLAYEPDQRYATARQLLEDIDRHLANQPLAHASERSLRERARKWARRHPRLSGGASALAASTVLLALLLGALVARHGEHRRLAARETQRQSLAEIRSAALMTERPDASPAHVDSANQLRGAIAARFELLTNDHWPEQDALALLPAEDQESLERSLIEMLVQWAWSETAAGAAAVDAQQRRRRLEHAWRLNERAGIGQTPDKMPRFVLEQRAKLAELLERPSEEVARWQALAAATPPRTVRDHLFSAIQALAEERFREAESMLLTATRETPQDLLGWLLLGHAYFAQSRFDQAIGCYSTCLALAPRSAWILFNRGLAYHRRGDLEFADEDYSAALRFDATLLEALLNRGLARLERGKARQALSDFLAARELPEAPARLHFLLARSYQAIGDAASANESLAAGLAELPADADSWVARGMARLRADPRAALADFEAALQMAPRSLPALLNRASALSEHLGQTEQGIAALDELLQRFPGYTDAISSRAVLQARLDRRESAMDDAREALRRDGRPAIAYQVAGAYALLSRKSADDRSEALRLLERAFREGYGIDLVERDPDLAHLQGDAELKSLVERFREVRTAGPAAAPR